ncbi:MAG: biotin--[acetyl-CoA-carboxylase] ligase, partial [Sphingobacterium sp.]
SLGIMDWLKSRHIPASIKWPNDLMISNKKIGGILIENSLNRNTIRQSVVGIGINVNQLIFPESLQDSASSIKKETGNGTEDLKQACLNICNAIGRRLTSFRKKEISADELLQAYNQHLFKRAEISWYFSNNETFEAKLIRVEKDGRLILNQNNKELSYNFKEVVFILQ